MRRTGFTLVELLTVISVLILLLGISAPSVSKARDMARMASCGAQMRQIGVALAQYTTESKQRVPPFIFSGMEADTANLPLSGHFGGSPFPGRKGADFVNLYALANSGYLSQPLLICPGSPQARQGKPDSYFADTDRFSTYCLRMPCSWDLYPGGVRPCTNLSDPLFIYLRSGSGQGFLATDLDGKKGPPSIAPFVRMDHQYQIDSKVACGSGRFDPAEDVLVSDAFWDQDSSQAAADESSFPVRRTWCHGQQFNRLWANGAVKSVRDDGTVASYSNNPARALAGDGVYNATYAEHVWQFFDGH